MSAVEDNRPHGLYRFYGANGRLLYIGITCDIGKRWDQHAKDKPWWTEVVGCTVEHFTNRADALEAERHAIRTECPVFNVQHAVRPAPTALPGFSYVGWYFLSDWGTGARGRILADLDDGLFEVETYSWREPVVVTSRTTMHFNCMDGWTFFPTRRLLDVGFEKAGIRQHWDAKVAVDGSGDWA